MAGVQPTVLDHEDKGHALEIAEWRAIKILGSEDLMEQIYHSAFQQLIMWEKSIPLIGKPVLFNYHSWP